MRGDRVLAPLTYLVLAVLGHLPAFRSLSTTTQCACRDAPQMDWFLAWTPFALGSGRTPWFTDHLSAPDGVNLMWNTSVPLPALLMWPVTATAGVLASHTVLAVLSFAVSATTMWLLAGRFAPWPWARFAAGLLYGFGPYVVGHGSGHLNLQLVALPPLVLLLAHDLFVRRPRPAAFTGALLALVALAQLLTSEEVLASTFVVAVLGTAVLAAQHPSAARARLREASVGLLTAAGLLTALAAWPLLAQFTGPQAIPGSLQDTSRAAADLYGTVVPTINQLLGSDVASTWGANTSENGSYLGPVLLAVLLVLGWRYRALPVVRFAGVLGIVSWVLSLGRELRLLDSLTGIPLPFALVKQVPLLHDMIASRFALYVALCAALVLAVGLDRLHAEGALRPRGAVPLAVLCVLPLVPAWPYGYERANVPAFFTGDAVQAVPEGSLALTYPVARFPTTAPMLWQAEAGFRYRTVGGYAYTPRPDGRGTFAGGQTLWERVVSRAPAAGELVVPDSARVAVLRELADLEAATLLVADGPGADEVGALVIELLGLCPTQSGGVSAWYDVDAAARLTALGLSRA